MQLGKTARPHGKETQDPPWSKWNCSAKECEESPHAVRKCQALIKLARPQGQSKGEGDPPWSIWHCSARE
eukprot:7500047-Karenia_brevis.AAC.1